jgi:hypothetical protein
MLEELELPIVAMFTTYVVVAQYLTRENYNQVFYTGIDEKRCVEIAANINCAHVGVKDDFRVRNLSLRAYLEIVFKSGFNTGRNTTINID